MDIVIRIDRRSAAARVGSNDTPPPTTTTAMSWLAGGMRFGVGSLTPFHAPRPNSVRSKYRTFATVDIKDYSHLLLLVTLFSFLFFYFFFFFNPTHPRVVFPSVDRVFVRIPFRTDGREKYGNDVHDEYSNVQPDDENTVVVTTEKKINREKNFGVPISETERVTTKERETAYAAPRNTLPKFPQSSRRKSDRHVFLSGGERRVSDRYSTVSCSHEFTVNDVFIVIALRCFCHFI